MKNYSKTIIFIVFSSVIITQLIAIVIGNLSPEIRIISGFINTMCVLFITMIIIAYIITSKTSKKSLLNYVKDLGDFVLMIICGLSMVFAEIWLSDDCSQKVKDEALSLILSASISLILPVITLRWKLGKESQRLLDKANNEQ